MLSANRSVSAVRTLSEVVMKLLTIFTREPVPGPPQSMIVSPMHSKTGRQVSRSPGVPPAMISEVPATASRDVRPSGASTIEWPRSASRCLMRSVSRGWIVDMSTTRAPAFRLSTAAPLPNRTSSTIVPLGSIVINRSTSRAASPAFEAARPPLRACWATASGFVSYPTTVWPPPTTFFAIPRPIVPSPMKPTFMIEKSSHLTDPDSDGPYPVQINPFLAEGSAPADLADGR